MSDLYAGYFSRNEAGMWSDTLLRKKATHARSGCGPVAKAWQDIKTKDRSLTDQIHSELALEIAEAREHWVVENEYNSHLQVGAWTSIITLAGEVLD
eukprot:scaffold32078_cov20-Tisochrysis_lutea.AAC.1